MKPVCDVSRRLSTRIRRSLATGKKKLTVFRLTTAMSPNLWKLQMLALNASASSSSDGLQTSDLTPVCQKPSMSAAYVVESVELTWKRRIDAQSTRYVLHQLRKYEPCLYRSADCLSSLNDVTARTRIAEVHEAHKKTFHWLFDPTVVTFARWLGNEEPIHESIYWIHGKPGSGKSTLMKLAMNDARLKNHLNMNCENDVIIAAYFFHDRGFEIQKTLQGMLQEVLYSILRQSTALLSIVNPLYLGLVQSQRTQTPKWDIESLKAALISIVEQSKVGTRILLFIDALDEHSGDNDTLVLLFKSLIQKAGKDSVKLKLCLASRSWTVFQQHFGTCPGFAIHEHTHDDVHAYVESRLRPSDGVETATNARGLSRIIDLITNKALGVFIWVKLVVDVVAKGIRDGTRYSVLETVVDRMPSELKDLYEDTLRRVEPDYTTESYIMLHMVYSSLVPLPLDTFMASLDVNLTANVDFNPFGPEETAAEYIAASKKRLTSRSGGLLEIVPTALSDQNQSTYYPWDFVVQFIHQTVKDYIRASPRTLGLINVETPIREQSGNLFLLKACKRCPYPWSCPIKRDIFEYAMGAFADGGYAPHDIVQSLKDALLITYNVSNSSTRSVVSRPYTTGVGHSQTEITQSEEGREMKSELKEEVADPGSVSEISAKHLGKLSLKPLFMDDKRDRGSYDLSWWLNEYVARRPVAPVSREVRRVGVFCRQLHDNIYSSVGTFNDERVLAMLAVAMRFEGYLKAVLPSLRDAKSYSVCSGLLHLAAAGPSMNMTDSSPDRSSIIRLILWARPIIDINEVFECSIFENRRHQDKSEGRKWTLSPLAYLLCHRGERDESSRLGVAKTLFSFGASPAVRIDPGHFPKQLSHRPMAFPADANAALNFCVVFESAAFVRLWLYQMQAPSFTSGSSLTSGKKIYLLQIAVLRQDRAINEVLQENGFSFDFIGEGNTSLQIFRIDYALFMSSQLLAAPSGGLITPF